MPGTAPRDTSIAAHAGAGVTGAGSRGYCRGMVRVLAVADEESQLLWGARVPALAPHLVISAGDLPWSYLEFISSTLDVPVVFVPGNHDPLVARTRVHRSGLHVAAGLPTEAPRPHGAINLDRKVLDIAGLRIAGLGGCVRYRPGPNMYSQREYHWLGRRLVWSVRRLQRRSPGGLDVLLTHAPPRGCGDEEDRAHQGVEALHRVLAQLQPRWHLHGHIHPHGRPRNDRQVGVTTVRNVIPYRLFDISSGTEGARAD